MTYEEYLDSMSYPDELTGIEEHERDSQYLGDARRCPLHPHIKTSSDDSMFDGLCSECEYIDSLPIEAITSPLLSTTSIQAANAASSTFTTLLGRSSESCILPPAIEEEDDICF